MPDFLVRTGPLGLEWWQWLGAGAALLVAVVIGAVAGRVLRSVARRLTRRTAATWDDVVFDRLAGPLAAALALAAAAAFVPWLDLPRAPAYRFVRAAYFATFFWSLFRLVDVGAHLLGESMLGRAGASRSLIPLGARVAKVGLLAIAAVAVLSYLGYPVASLLAGLGIGGLALALAAQKTVENLFGAFSIGVDQPFRVGDTVKVEDFLATVERIGLRSTRFRTLDRTVITIPNGKLADSRVESYSARDRIRLHTIIGLVYGSTESQVRAVLAGFEAVLRAHPKFWAEAFVVRLRELGPFSINIEVTAWFQTEDFAEFQGIRQEVLLQFLGVVERSGTALAFPTQTVVMKQETGDRRQERGDREDGRA